MRVIYLSGVGTCHLPSQACHDCVDHSSGEQPHSLPSISQLLHHLHPLQGVRCTWTAWLLLHVSMSDAYTMS